MQNKKTLFSRTMTQEFRPHSFAEDNELECRKVNHS